MYIYIGVGMTVYVVGILVGMYIKRPGYEKINLNDFAKKVTLVEGKKKSLTIAQVKEVIGIVFKNLNQEQLNYIKKTCEE